MNSTPIPPPGFDLFRLQRSKATVDISPNTLRAYRRRGLKFHRLGRAVFISRKELEAFITKQRAA